MTTVATWSELQARLKILGFDQSHVIQIEVVVGSEGVLVAAVTTVARDAAGSPYLVEGEFAHDVKHVPVADLFTYL